MPDLTDRCPSWCAHHDRDDEMTAHTAVIGFAGPLEVALICWALDGQPDPITELQLRNIGDTSASADPITVPLDTDVDQLAQLLDAAIAVSQL